MTRKLLVRASIIGLTAAAAASVASAARADTIQIEAELVRVQSRFSNPDAPVVGTITSPLKIVDDPAASGGSYITVAAGNNSPSTAPASTSEGVAKYFFGVATAGSYRIWARVSGATTGDDSFWIRSGSSGAWTNWNGFTLGTAWHWVQVKANGATSAATFNLAAGRNQLQIAYREDGAKLDELIITDSATFNPAAAITGPPALPVMQPGVAGGGSTKISWSSVPGATSYNLETSDGGCDCVMNDDGTSGPCTIHPFTVKAPGLTGFSFVDVGSGGGIYRVTAVGASGSSQHPGQIDIPSCDFPEDISRRFIQGGTFDQRTQVNATGVVTSPMKDLGGATFGAPAGTNSTSTVPAHGRFRMDFELAAPATLRMWAEIGSISGPVADPKQDSFWVRWDDGAWINWNNLDGFCETLHDSAKSGSPIVRQLLPAGSHRIEWAYREGGTMLLDNIILIEDSPNQREQCSD